MARLLGPAYENIRDKILSRVDQDHQTGCWIWRGAWNCRVDQGYTTTPSRAANIAWMKIHRDDRTHMQRTCANWRCVNPDHCALAGTERVRSAWEKLGVNRGENNRNTIVSDAGVLEIKRLAAKGESYKSISQKFGVVPEYCRILARGKARKYIGGPITYKQRRLTPGVADEIRIEADNYFLKHHTHRGMAKSIAEKFGLKPPHVASIIAGRIWKHTPVAAPDPNTRVPVNRSDYSNNNFHAARPAPGGTWDVTD